MDLKYIHIRVVGLREVVYSYVVQLLLYLDNLTAVEKFASAAEPTPSLFAI